MPSDRLNVVPERRFALFKGNNWELPSDITLVNLADRVLKKKLMDAGWEEGEAGEFVIFVFHELLINAIAHGNLGIPAETKDIWGEARKRYREGYTDKTVDVDIQIKRDEITLTIHDHGEGYDREKVVDGGKDEYKMRTTGRGGIFMEHFADSIVRTDKNRKVVVKKNRKNIKMI